MIDLRMMSARAAAVALGAAVLGSGVAGCGGQRSLLAVKESGDRAYERAQYDEALAEYQEFVERLPGDPGGRLRLGKAYLKTGQPLQAREHLFIAYSQNVDNDEVVEALAEALNAAGQHEDLYRLLRQRALDRGRVDDYLRLARFAQQVGDADEARQALLTAARIDGGKTAAIQVALADFYASVNDRPAAVERLRMAYYLDPANPDVHRRIREQGEVPGPSFGVVPDEQNG